MTGEITDPGLKLDEYNYPACIKCGAQSGDDWAQCEGSCPVTFSPHYDIKKYGSDSAISGTAAASAVQPKG